MEVPTASRGGRGWVLFNCLASYFLSIVLLYQMSPFFQTYASDCCDASATTVGLIFAALPFASFLAALPGGLLVAKFGSRLTLGVSLLALAGSSVGFGLSASIPSFFFWRTVQGVASALVYTSITVTLMQAYPRPDELAFANGLQETVGNLGFALGPALGGFLYDQGGFLAPFAASAVGHVLFVVVAACLPAPESAAPAGRVPLLGSGEASERRATPSIWRKDVLCVGAGAAITISFWGALEPLLANHFRACLGQEVSTSTIGLILALAAVSSSVGAISTPRLVRLMPTSWLMALGLAIISVSCAMLGISNPEAHVQLGLPTLGLPVGSPAAWRVQGVLMFTMGIGYAWAWTPAMPEMLAAASASADGADVAPQTAALFNCMVALGEAIGPAAGGVAFAARGFGAASIFTAVLTGGYILPLVCVLRKVPSPATPPATPGRSAEELRFRSPNAFMPAARQRRALSTAR